MQVGENERPEDAMARLDNELGVPDWWTPAAPRPVTPPRPRITEDGLSIPSWWTDEETESQRWLTSQGVILDA